MRKFLDLTALVAVLALVGGCNQQAADEGSQPTGSGPAPVASGTSPEPAGPATPAGPGDLTPGNTKIEFVGKKSNGQHFGNFQQFSGSISPIEDDFTKSRVTVEIDTESLQADDPKLTNHLKSPDFFEVRKYPKASFVSTDIRESKEGDATHVITGDLTLHGTTKPVSIPVKVTRAEDTLTLDGTFTIDRLDYGITFNPQMVEPIVTITVSAKVPSK